MILFAEPDERPYQSPLGRVSPLVKLAVAALWLGGLALTLDPRPSAVLLVVAIVAALTAGAVPPRRLALGALPLVWAAVGIGLFNALFSGANLDPSLPEVARLGPWRITERGLLGGVGLGCRVLAIAVSGVVFTLTTDPTRFVDALVWQAGLPARFAYGALAAYQAVPRLVDDLTTLREARRVRGLRGGWHPRIVVGLLILAVRHAEALALAMDARAFGAGPRTLYRELRWWWGDLLCLAGGVVALAAALAAGSG
jgi:energy-coupling factor transport system permease protein